MEQLLLHLDAAYNLARWLTRNSHDAEDVVQEAYLRAFKFFGSFNGGDGRKWLLAIVQNTCYTWLKRNRGGESTVAFDEEIHSENIHDVNPETIFMRKANSWLVKEALEELPPVFREVVILREMEGLSYKEIADIVGIPIGTVMSRLGRARKRLQSVLTQAADRGLEGKGQPAMSRAVAYSDPLNLRAAAVVGKETSSRKISDKREHATSGRTAESVPGSAYDGVGYVM